MSQEFEQGPKIRQDVNDQLAIAYDFETESGEYAWAELRFSGVAAFRFTAARHCSEDQISAYDSLQELRSRWAEDLSDPPSDLRHYRIYFDDVGCYEVLARTFEPPMPRL